MEAAYVAGIFDADGCVGIYEAIKNNEYRRYMRCQVMVANNNGLLMWEFKHQYGGSVCYTSSTCMQWRQDSKDKVRIFLEDILPFLIVKKKQAVVALELLSIPKNSRELQHRELRDQLRIQIAALKKEVVPYES
jgi:hypothetical protein